MNHSIREDLLRQRQRLLRNKAELDAEKRKSEKLNWQNLKQWQINFPKKISKRIQKMTVRELMEQLSNMNKDSKVVITMTCDNDFPECSRGQNLSFLD